ncbi:DUF6415 family natural product biosynthesis protein [Streptomyces sp. enrichment culture]|uniref:DUF6415 family natural product biosynthesis protein n=1 Tax=Streptomyces sp. enrichment culture TaxID=1795815 RepID=UPI003F557FAC
MTASAVIPRWTPPLDAEALSDVLARVQVWVPFDADVVLDDAAIALDEVPPAKEDTEKIAGRLRGHLMRLVTIAVATETEQDTAAAQLIEHARLLGAEDLPGDHREAVGQLRRMGWTASELLDRLVAMRCLKEVA